MCWCQETYGQNRQNAFHNGSLKVCLAQGKLKHMFLNIEKECIGFSL